MDKLPKGWKYKMLSEVGEIVTGNTPPKNDSSFYENGTIPFVKPPDLGKGIVITTNEKITIKALTKSRLIPKNSIMVCCIGSLGKIGISGTDLITNQQINSIILNPELVDFNYGYYYSLTLEKYMNETANKAVVAIINKSTFSKYKIPLPLSKSEQTQIVSKLDDLFARIDKCIVLLEENIKHTKGLMASVLEEVFRDAETKWNNLPLNKVAKVDRGKSKHRPRNDEKLFGGTYPFIQTGDVRRAFKYIESHEVFYSEFGLKQSRLWKRGTICLTIAANIGDVAILGFDACFPDSVVGITPNSMNNEFLYYYLKTLQLQLDKKANSAAQKNINLKILSEIDVPVPSIEIQNSIADRFSRLEEKQFQILSAQQSKLTYLKALKSSLLDRAFKGDL